MRKYEESFLSRQLALNPLQLQDQIMSDSARDTFYPRVHIHVTTPLPLLLVVSTIFRHVFHFCCIKCCMPSPSVAGLYALGGIQLFLQSCPFVSCYYCLPFILMNLSPLSYQSMFCNYLHAVQSILFIQSIHSLFLFPLVSFLATLET